MEVVISSIQAHMVTKATAAQAAITIMDMVIQIVMATMDITTTEPMRLDLQTPMPPRTTAQIVAIITMTTTVMTHKKMM